MGFRDWLAVNSVFFLAGVVGWALQTFGGMLKTCPRMFVARADRSKFSGIEEVHLSYGGLLRDVSTIFGLAGKVGLLPFLVRAWFEH